MEKNDTAEAILTENGKIAAVGGREELAALAPGAETIPLDGAALLPSFVDAHSHFSQVAMSFLQVSLEGVRSYGDICERIRFFIRETGPAPGSWIICSGYDQTILPSGKHIPLALLDACSDGFPTVLQHKSGHMGIFSSTALALLGITSETPAPDGGRIEKQAGQLTGYLEENAFIQYAQKIPMADGAALRRAYGQAQSLYASCGITTVQEGMIVKPMLPLIQMLTAEKLLRLDVVGYPAPDVYSEAAALFPAPPGQYRNHFRIGGIKLILDGSPQGRTAWMRTPYRNGEPTYCGYGAMRDEDVLTAMRFAAANRLQLLAHCNGDAAAAQMLRCLDCCEKEYPEMKELRPVMIHAQLLGRDQLAGLRRLGIIPSFFIAHVWHWGDVHIRNFGPERAFAISPAASALAAQIPFTFHQDSPVIRPDMLETVWCAVTRRTKEGVPLGPDERISAAEALKAVTVNAAYQYGEENSKGSIRVGKHADFVVLDRDPLSVPADELRDIRVLGTWQKGQPIYSAD